MLNTTFSLQVTLTNKSNAMTSFSFPQMAHFKMIPSKGSLTASQSLSVVLSFQPSQLGSFKSIAHMDVSDGLATVDIKLHGVSESPEGKKILVGGIDKVSSDFERKLKYVDPARVLRDKMESDWSRIPEKDSESLTSLDRDSMYGMNR